MKGMENQFSKSVIHQIFHILLFVFGSVLIGTFIFYFNYGQNIFLKTLGVFLWVLSAVLGWLPIYIFTRKGGVKKGNSFVKTTKLVTTGIYSIIRHPQYLAGILLCVSFILISQHWLVLVLAIPLIIIFYIAVLDEDRSCLKKFGSSYNKYMERVPRINLILGLIRFFFSINSD